MSSSVRRISLAGLLACGVAFSLAAVAQASNATIQATLKSANPTVLKEQAKVLDGIATYDKSHSPSALITAINTQVKTLDGLKTKISSEAASTAKGTKGKAEIVKGLALIVTSGNALVKDLQAAGSKQVPKAELTATSAADKKGNAELAAGVKLLGLG